MQVGDQQVTVPASTASERPALAAYEGRTLALGIRPDQLEDAALVRDGNDDRLRGRVLLTEALGSEVLVHVEVPGKAVLSDDVLEGAVDMEDALVDDRTQRADDEQMTLVGRFDPESTVRPDDIVEVAVDATKLQFFDIDTGKAIRSDASTA